MRFYKYLFLITVLYFALAFINIHFALLGILCMAFPFILLFKNKQKTWCQKYCPRASLFSGCGKWTEKFSMKTPVFFTKGNMKWILLAYFGFNLFAITMSTFKVASGSIPPMNYLRFLLFLPIPVKLPQLVEITEILPWMTHLSYRFYSMMMTTTTLGFIMALFYKPRTWCTVCPIATVSNAYLTTRKQ